MTILPYRREHAAMDRLEGPIGQEIARIQSDLEQIVSEFTNNGAVDSHGVHMMRTGLERLEKFGELCALRDDLMERAREVGRLVDYLGDHQDPHALGLLQGRLNHQMEVVSELAERHTA